MKTRKLFSPAIGCTVLVLAAGELQADAWQKEPSYGVELGYSDNYTLEPEPVSDDAQNRIQAVSTLKATAGLALIQLKPSYTAKIEGKLIATSYGGDIEGYKKTTPLTGGGKEVVTENGSIVYEGSRLDTRLDGALNLGIEKLQERAVWRFDASLLTDSLLQDISLDAVIDEQDGISDIDDGAVREDVTRTRLNISPSYLFKLSPISFFRTALSVSTVAYDNTATSTLKDYDQQKLSGFYSREFTPVNSWSIDGEVRNYEADEAGQFDSAVIGLGVSHNFSETTEFGLRFAQSTTSFDYGDTSGRASKPLVQLTGSKKTGRTVYSLRMGAELYGSATGDVVRADELLFNAVYQYSELMTLTWRNKLFQNKSLRDKFPDPAEGEPDLSGEELAYNLGIDESNRRYLAFEPTLNWRFSRWWVLDTGLRYQREKRDSLGNSGESAYAFVGVTFSKPIEAKPEY